MRCQSMRQSTDETGSDRWSTGILVYQKRRQRTSSAPTSPAASSAAADPAARWSLTIAFSLVPEDAPVNVPPMPALMVGPNLRRGNSLRRRWRNGGVTNNATAVPLPMARAGCCRISINVPVSSNLAVYCVITGAVGSHPIIL